MEEREKVLEKIRLHSSQEVEKLQATLLLRRNNLLNITKEKTQQEENFLAGFQGKLSKKSASRDKTERALTIEVHGHDDKLLNREISKAPSSSGVLFDSPRRQGGQAAELPT